MKTRHAADIDQSAYRILLDGRTDAAAHNAIPLTRIEQSFERQVPDRLVICEIYTRV